MRRGIAVLFGQPCHDDAGDVASERVVGLDRDVVDDERDSPPICTTSAACRLSAEEVASGNRQSHIGTAMH